MNLFCFPWKAKKQTKQICLFVFWGESTTRQSAFGFIWPLAVHVSISVLFISASGAWKKTVFVMLRWKQRSQLLISFQQRSLHFFLERHDKLDKKSNYTKLWAPVTFFINAQNFPNPMPPKEICGHLTMDCFESILIAVTKS